MESDYRVRAASFLKLIFPYIKNCSHFYAYKTAINEFNRKYSRNVCIACGMTRIALMSSDYVIKFDYDDYEVNRFGGCEDEVKFYAFAKKEGFDYLFAEITPIVFKDRKFYIMPRIAEVGKYDSNVDDFLDGDDLDFINAYLYDMHNENYGWRNDYPVIIDYALNIFFEQRHQKNLTESSTETNPYVSTN